MYVGKRGRFATRLESSEQLQQQTVNKKTTIEIGYSYNKKMMVQWIVEALEGTGEFVLEILCDIQNIMNCLWIWAKKVIIMNKIHGS